MYRPTPEERETILRFDEASDECTVWTADKKVAGRLARGGAELVKEPHGWRTCVPKQSLRLKLGKRSCYPAGRSPEKGAAPPRKRVLHRRNEQRYAKSAYYPTDTWEDAFDNTRASISGNRDA